MFNVNLIGRLTADPEQKVTKNNNQYVEFNMAINQGKDEQGQDKVVFVRCSIFGKLGETALKYLLKGKRVAVNGNITDISAYTPQNGGNPRVSVNCMISNLEIIDWPENNQQTGTVSAQSVAPPASPGYPPQAQYGAPPAAPGYPPQTPQYPTTPNPTPPPQPQRFTDARGDWELQNGQWVLVRPATQAAPPPSTPPAGAPWSNGPL